MNNIENIRIIIRDEMLNKKGAITGNIYIKEEKKYLNLLKVEKMEKYYSKKIT